MIFDRRYKYIRRLAGGDELYDLAEDPQETTNLLLSDIASSSAMDVLPRLKEQMLTWLQETADTVPRQYDARVTPEKKWAWVSAFCPPQLKDIVMAHIRSNMDEDVFTLIAYIRNLIGTR
jgi:hypothetical protein